MNAPNRQESEIAAELQRGGGARLYDEVLGALRRSADAHVLIAGRKSYTGTELGRRLTTITHRLHREGIREGAVVLLAMRPSADLLVLMLALLRIGATVTPIDLGIGPELFQRRLARLQPSWVFAESAVYAAGAGPSRWLLRRRGLNVPRLREVPARHVVVGSPKWVAPRHASSWDELLLQGRDIPQRDLPAPDARCRAMIIFTSGTTGEPKGVQHSGLSAASSISMILDNLNAPHGAVFSSQSVFLTVAAILAARPTVMAPLNFNPQRWLRSADQNRISHAFLRPSDAYSLTTYCRRRRRNLPDSLRQIMLYSAPVTTTLLRRLHALGGSELKCFSVYGMTEALPVSWVDAEERLAWEGNGDLVGRPLPGIDVRVGETGTLQVRGPNVYIGYLDMEPVEWHDTLDLAQIESDGSIVLRGRAKDMILRDSFNIYPGLYEDTISQIDGVAECAMVGVPDADSGNERVFLFVASDYGGDARQRRLLQQRVRRELQSGPAQIDHGAQPDEVIVLRALPCNRQGKIDRLELRHLAAKML